MRKLDEIVQVFIDIVPSHGEGACDEDWCTNRD